MSNPLAHSKDLVIFEKLFRYNSLPVLLTNADSLEIIDANIEALKFFDTDEKDLVNKPLSDFAVLSAQEFNAAVLSFVNNNYTGLEISFKTKNKGIRNIELHYTITELNQHKLLLCVLVEVTDRNYAISALKEIKENLYEEVKRQTSDLVRINNSLIVQIRNRQKAEEELRQSQEMFFRLFQLNPNGMILKSIETNKVVEVNMSFLNIFGYKKEEVENNDIESLNILCDTYEYKIIQQQILENNEVRKIPFTMASNKGHVRFILFSGEIIKLEKGEFVLEFYEDITDIHIAQKRLTYSEERYRTMYNNALVGIYRAEIKTGNITTSNLQFAKMLGYKSEKELIGKSILKHYPQINDRVDLIKKLKKNLTTVHEYELISTNNKKIWVVNYARYCPEEGSLDGVVVDITDRKVMENLLIKNENRFRSMTENASDIILIVDAKGNALYLSPSINKELGYEIFSSDKVNILDYVHPKDKASVLKNLKNKKGIRYSEAKVKHLNQAYKVYEYTTTNLVNDPSVGGIIINAHDITAQVKAREEINLSLQKEQELNRQKTQFISTVSHEFRTPLTNISLNIQLLDKYVQENRTDKVGAGIERMNNAVKRLTSLLNDVSMISKDQSGRLEFVPEEWETNKLIEELMDQISYMLQSNVKATIDKGTQQTVLADKNLISHILTNLVGNAIKYSSKNEEVTISIKITKEEKLEIEVTDNGIGIPEGEIMFLFDPYFRASNAKQISGTGIGLSIVKRCVELHKGEIFAKSNIGEGTQMFCSIPLFNAKNKIHILDKF
jgi:PAS domain S-box-containing protein